MDIINGGVLSRMLVFGAGAVIIASTIIGCTSTTDPMKASGADLLFNPSRFEAANEERRAALIALREQGDQLDADRETLEANLAELERKVEEWRAAIDQRQQRIAELEREIVDLERQARRGSRQIAEVRQRRNELEWLIEQRETLVKEVAELERARDVLKERLDVHIQQERSRFDHGY